MVRSIAVENFRAFQKQGLELKPITVLIGPNNSGKSSLVSALALLAQTVRSPDTDSPISLRGEFEDLGTYRDMVFRNDRRKRVSFVVAVDVPGEPVAPGRPSRAGRPPRASENDVVEFAFRLQYRDRRREIVIERLDVRSSIHGALLQCRYSPSAEDLLVSFLRGSESPESVARGALFMRNFLPMGAGLLFRAGPSGIADREAGPARETAEAVERATWALWSALESVEFVGPFREPPARTYLFAGGRPASVGPTGGKAVEMLASDASRRGRALVPMADRLSRWMSDAGMASSLSLEALTDRHFELKLTHPVTGERENVADVGYGCSQVLPVLIAGYSLLARPRHVPPVLVVQQPELHLHPRAQAELAAFFAELCREGVYTVIETHSEHLVVRLQSYVADPEVPLSADDVAVYYVHPENAATKVAKRMRLDETGTFIDEWPEGFFPEGLDEAKRLARMRLKRAREGA